MQIESAVGSHLYHCNATLPIPFRPIQKHCYILDLKLCLPSLFITSIYLFRPYKEMTPTPKSDRKLSFNSLVGGFVITMMKLEISQLLHICYVVFMVWEEKNFDIL